jgi:hypothetical protein
LITSTVDAARYNAGRLDDQHEPQVIIFDGIECDCCRSRLLHLGGLGSVAIGSAARPLAEDYQLVVESSGGHASGKGPL